MLKESLAQAGNLMDTNYSFPRKMITFLRKRNPIRFGTCFSDFWPLKQI